MTRRRVVRGCAAVVSGALCGFGTLVLAGPPPSDDEVDRAFRIFLNVKEDIVHRCIYRPSEADILRGAQKELTRQLGPDFASFFAPLPAGDFPTLWPIFQRTLIKIVSSPKSKVPLQALVEQSLRGYCTMLDRYSEYDDLESWRAEKKLKRPDYFGLGMTIARTATGYECYPFPGGPADLIGTDPGDRLLEVSGREVRGRPLVDVGSMFIGKAGEEVRFKVEHRRSGKLEMLVAKRDKIRASLIDVETTADGATVHLRWLNESTVKDLRDFLRTLDVGAAFTLDLRGCHGGDLSAAVAIAQMFLPAGAVIARVETLRGTETFTSENPNPYRARQMIILQDRGTMSGAELIIVALVKSSAVHAESRGEKTFGKGVTISEDEIQGGGGRLRITESYIYGPNGEFWEGEGLAPSVEMEPAPKP